MNSSWRHAKPIGLQLTSSSQHIVRSNFFPIISNLSEQSINHSVPTRIFHYNVSIFKYIRVQSSEMMIEQPLPPQEGQEEDGEVQNTATNANANRFSVIIDTEDLAKDKDKARNTGNISIHLVMIIIY